MNQQESISILKKDIPNYIYWFSLFLGLRPQYLIAHLSTFYTMGMHVVCIMHNITKEKRSVYNISAYCGWATDFSSGMKINMFKITSGVLLLQQGFPHSYGHKPSLELSS